MNILCGVLNQTEGDIYIDGIDLRKEPEIAKKQIGFLPQTAPLYLDLTVDEYLIHCARLRLIDKQNIKVALEDAKERCGISHFSKRLISNLSGGYRQRVGIAQAIIHRPKLVVLDEPTNGLDPNQILEVRKLIKDIASERAVIFSSHILTEVQILCKDIIMIESGRTVFSNTMEAFNNYVEPHSCIVCMINQPDKKLMQSIEGVTKIDQLSGNTYRIFFDGDQQIAERVIKVSVQHDWKLRELSFDKNSLDEIFAQLSNKSITKP